MIEWKSIPGFSKYEASSDGEIRNKKTGRILKFRPHHKWGYLKGNLKNDEGKVKTIHLHSLIALAFIGPKPEGQCVRHINDDRLNNRAENITYGEYYENIQDAIRNGCIKSDLTEEKVVMLWRLRAQGISERNIAVQLNVPYSQVRNVLHYGYWDWAKKK